MKKHVLSILFSCFSLLLCAQITVDDATINAGDSFTMTSDNEYILDGYVYVEEGATLTIEPGTVIRGKSNPTGDDLTSALIITKGARIIADGTAAQPIIFTGDIDDLASTEDLTAEDNNTWGGIIILGNGIVGEDGGEDVIEEYSR